MREIKFRQWSSDRFHYWGCNADNFTGPLSNRLDIPSEQFTGLHDKNGKGLQEVWEGDIISEEGLIKGNIHETNERGSDLLIPRMGTKAWNVAYKKAVDRGFDFAE